jgi:uncharacterized protein (DUF433 family)
VKAENIRILGGLDKSESISNRSWAFFSNRCPFQNRMTSCYHSDMDYSKIITIEPGKRSGKPCIRGTRMSVTDVLEYLAGGMSQEEILADFPDLRMEDIKACLAFAADRERKLATLPEHETVV